MNASKFLCIAKANKILSETSRIDTLDAHSVELLSAGETANDSPVYSNRP
jgi:hypothetical protein